MITVGIMIKNRYNISIVQVLFTKSCVRSTLLRMTQTTANVERNSSFDSILADKAKINNGPPETNIPWINPPTNNITTLNHIGYFLAFGNIMNIVDNRQIVIP